MKNIFLSFIILVANQLSAQTVSSNDILKHVVAPKETIYSLSRAFNIHPKVIMAANPNYAPDFALKINDIIFIPIEKMKVVEDIPSSEESPIEQKKDMSTKAMPVLENTAKNNLDKEAKVPPKKMASSTSTPTSTRSISNNRHVVKKGETITTIAMQYRMNPKDLMALNSTYAPSFELKENDDLVIILPTNEVFGSMPPVPMDKNNATQSKESAKTHIVQKGETMFSIARQYNISAKELMKMNPNLGPDFKLRLGDKIILTSSNNLVNQFKTLDTTQAAILPNDETAFSISYVKLSSESDKNNNILANNREVKPFLKLIEHYVCKNETLLDIGNHYGILITNIMQLNQLKTVKLKEGQRLFIHPEWIQPMTSAL